MTALGFVDNANVVAYGKGTKENLRTLEAFHKECEKWAAKTAEFTSTKYELIHLARSPNRSATIKQ